MNFTQWAKDLWSGGDRGASSINELATYDKYGQNSSAFFVATFTQDNSGSNVPISIYQCNLFNVSRTVEFRFLNGQSSFLIQNTTILNPANIGQINTAFYGDSARSYMFMSDALGEVLLGLIGVYNKEYLVTARTNILTTPLVTSQDFPSFLNTFLQLEQGTQTEKPLGRAIEEVMLNITLSLFSRPQYRYAVANFTFVCTLTWLD